jgi:3-phosphoshikimate 1-carboxyvinyltransferase
MKTIEIKPARTLGGSVSIPGDKSISHRALMLASLADGESRIDNLLEGHDCIATVHVMRALGVHISLEDGSWVIKGCKKNGLHEPASILDCKNSGTTMRMMAGLLSAMPFMSVLDGSDQIKLRPMDRVIHPLRAIGARIFGRREDRLAPLVILPSKITGGVYTLSVKSAQVKSAMILAGLFGDGDTKIYNTLATRDHTERLLSFMGADVEAKEDSVVIKPLSGELKPLNFVVPGDISSAAFLLVAAVILADDEVVLKNVGINQTRTGIIDALKMMGANISFKNERWVAKELVADLHVKKSPLKSATFFGDHIVRMIDEIPILALAATQAFGTTVIRDASELKVKESNRIMRSVEALSLLGADIHETEDGLIIPGKTKRKGGVISSFGDHRMALCLCIAGLISSEGTKITNAEVTDDSFPGFVNSLLRLGADVKEVSHG